MIRRWPFIICLLAGWLATTAASAQGPDWELTAGASLNTGATRYEYFPLEGRSFQLDVNQGYTRELLFLRSRRIIRLGREDRFFLAPEAGVEAVLHNQHSLLDTQFRRHYLGGSAWLLAGWEINPAGFLQHRVLAGAGWHAWGQRQLQYQEKGRPGFRVAYELGTMQHRLFAGLSLEWRGLASEYTLVPPRGDTTYRMEGRRCLLGLYLGFRL